MEEFIVDNYFTTKIWFVKMTSDKKSPFYLTSFERELFGCIQSLSSKRPCTASDSYFASIFKVSIKHTNTSIGKLKKMGIINIVNSYKKRQITSNVNKGGALCAIDEQHIWFMDLSGLLKIPISQMEHLPTDFHLLPRNEDGSINIP